MLAELVRTETPDGVSLHGALFAGSEANDRAVVILHGVGGNFYGSRLLNGLAERLRSWGSVLRVNTRGRDGVYQGADRDGPRPMGSAFELVDHCRLDVLAWLHWLQDRGFSEVAVVGHSLGAVKALYSQAFQTTAAVVAVAALSPPRLSAAAFAASDRREAFESSLRDAERKMDAGRPAALIQSRFPFPMPIAAEAYLDKYGGERYNLLNFADRILCPTLFVFGRAELDQAGTFAGLPEALAELPGESARTIEIVDAADHFYRGREESLYATVADWLVRL